MSKDHLERRMYRKSPGRQYGYDYDPLRSRDGADPKSYKGDATSRSSMLLAQRPDPRRTRQLMRRSIIASKRPNEDGTEQPEFSDREAYKEEVESLAFSAESPSRRPARTGRLLERSLPLTSDLYLQQDAEYGSAWRDLNAVDPDLGIAEPLNRRVRYAYDDAEDYEDEPSLRSAGAVPIRQPQPKLTRRLEPEHSSRVYPDEDEGYHYEYQYEEDRGSVSRSSTRSKKKLSRRGLLIGAGAGAATVAAAIAYETIPKLPQAVTDVSSNAEHQIQDAFNRGVSQGVDQARQEIVTSLESIEGFTLEGAMTAARLTRVAYDVFVSPIVKFGAVITGDVLVGMLKAFKTAREWLAGVYQDNATLIAIQKVLESWVNQVNVMPKQLDAITQSDLDGAQAYLRALQRKIEDEKTKLNQTQKPGATAKATSVVTPTPTKQPAK